MAKRRRRRSTKSKARRTVRRVKVVAARTVRRVSRRVRSMARRSSRRRRSAVRVGGGGARGFINKDVLFAVGGAVAGGFVGPMLRKVMPKQLTGNKFVLAGTGLAVSMVAYKFLSKYNKSLAIGIAASIATPSIMALFSKPASLRGLGGVADSGDGADYGLGEDDLSGDDDLTGYLSGDDDLSGAADELDGLGQYTDEYTQVM